MAKPAPATAPAPAPEPSKPDPALDRIDAAIRAGVGTIPARVDKDGKVKDAVKFAAIFLVSDTLRGRSVRKGKATLNRSFAALLVDLSRGDDGEIDSDLATCVIERLASQLDKLPESTVKTGTDPEWMD